MVSIAARVLEAMNHTMNHTMGGEMGGMDNATDMHAGGDMTMHGDMTHQDSSAAGATGMDGGSSFCLSESSHLGMSMPGGMVMYMDGTNTQEFSKLKLSESNRSILTHPMSLAHYRLSIFSQR